MRGIGIPLPMSVRSYIARLTPARHATTMRHTAMTEPPEDVSSAFSEPARGARRARSDNRRIPPEPPAQRDPGRQ